MSASLINDVGSIIVIGDEPGRTTPPAAQHTSTNHARAEVGIFGVAKDLILIFAVDETSRLRKMAGLTCRGLIANAGCFQQTIQHLGTFDATRGELFIRSLMRPAQLMKLVSDV